ncbi:hypothetical protein TL18_02660 [Methanobrevibacter sp. YE315]|uniref:hypothetical protein n=1 Tax=Methanobrevibacter sp. YE315 TaxID=1609968 RepID=UPI000764D870|nr:hypothetical protein [Methanobrevibacter sp. YE315]AMD18426.1 hypothetical protein TL18_02660 [Methanobrevibacter sp. YE315]
MKLYLLEADNSKDMERISDELSQKKFKIMEEDDAYILMRKRRYGNPVIHVISLIIALAFFSPFIFVNVAYFTYSYLWASPHALITTEKVDDEGNPLEFSDIDEVLNKAYAIL